MTNLSIKTALAALLAGSLAATAGMPAFARADGGSVDPAKFQERIEKRVDKALNGTDATRLALQAGKSAAEIVAGWKAGEDKFRAERKGFLLY